MSKLVERDWADPEGRLFRFMVEEHIPADQANLGILLGPQCDTSTLGLTLEQDVRLHNQLHARGIWNDGIARRRRQDVHAALMAALRVDAERVIESYAVQGID